MIDKYKNKILCMDAYELMQTLPDKSIDLVLTDPPYGINETAKKNDTRGKLTQTTTYNEYFWDKERIEKKCFDEMLRISKNQVIFGGNYYLDYLYPTRCFLVWDKDNGKTDFADCELAWTSFTTSVRLFKFKWQGMLQQNMKEKEKRYHPTQKPKALFRWIIQKYSKETDIILDPFAGSFTTAKACQELGRDWICCDNEQTYCDAGRKRLDEQPLFNF